MQFYNECSECNVSYFIETDSGDVTTFVPSNAVRGSGHIPAHTVEVSAYTADEVLWCWECPACGYAESEYVDDETREALA